MKIKIYLEDNSVFNSPEIEIDTDESEDYTSGDIFLKKENVLLKARYIKAIRYYD